MNRDYRALTESVRRDLNPDDIPVTRQFSEEMATLAYSDVLVYVRTAMKAVDPQYTQRTKDAGERAKEHLKRELSSVSFQYQGSVMTNTHIRGYSDIDLLTICEKFYGWDKSNIEEIISKPERRQHYREESIQKLLIESLNKPYEGSSLQDLHHLRQECERILSAQYSVCDPTKPKSIKIKNLALGREVDVVIANWFDDVMSVIHGKGEYRGVEVYDKQVPQRCPADYPFLSISRINAKSGATNGRLKRMIRFLKNCKARSDLDINLSSFDINAICYDIPEKSYVSADFYELVPVIRHQLASLQSDSQHSNRLTSVDGRERIFFGKPDKMIGLNLLLAEVSAIHLDLIKSSKVTV